VLLVVGLCIVIAIPKTITGDARLRFETLEDFIRTGHLVSPKYSSVGPVLSAPLYLLGRAFGAAKLFASFFNAVLFVAWLSFVWREFRDELRPQMRRALLLLLLFASMFMHHAQRYYGEVFTTVLVASGVFMLARGHAQRGWAAIILGALNTPASLVAIVGISICHSRRLRSWLPLCGPVVAFALMRLESRLERGSWFDTGYNYDSGFHSALPYAGLPNFSYPFFFGLLSILFSFGKGLVFFAPGLFILLPSSAPARFRWVHTTLVVYVCGLVLTYAKWWSWYGGWFWGPRFFLAASIPACFSLAANLADWPSLSVGRRVLVTVALLLSFWVGANGVAFQGMGLSLCTANYFALAEYCYYVPEMSVLWHPFVDGGASIPESLRPLSFVAVGLWAVAALWVGRELLANLVQHAARFTREWRAWW
jgi:hypothetical protein